MHNNKKIFVRSVYWIQGKRHWIELTTNILRQTMQRSVLDHYCGMWPLHSFLYSNVSRASHILLCIIIGRTLKTLTSRTDQGASIIIKKVAVRREGFLKLSVSLQNLLLRFTFSGKRRKAESTFSSSVGLLKRKIIGKNNKTL